MFAGGTAWPKAPGLERVADAPFGTNAAVSVDAPSENRNCLIAFPPVPRTMFRYQLRSPGGRSAPRSASWSAKLRKVRRRATIAALPFAAESRSNGKQVDGRGGWPKRERPRRRFRRGQTQGLSREGSGHRPLVGRARQPIRQLVTISTARAGFGSRPHMSNRNDSQRLATKPCSPRPEAFLPGRMERRHSCSGDMSDRRGAAAVVPFASSPD
jgi:hypothetical protein